MIKTIGYAATRFHKSLKPKVFEREAAGDDAVELDVLFCGVCHSDIHQADNDWKNTVYPCVPGHEVVGKVARVGKNVSSVKVGDLAAVGCIIDSCGTCFSCQKGEEQYCEAETGMLATYNGPMNPTGQNTYGGYSDHLVVKEKYLIPLPEGISPEAAGPILCAGVTTYSPLKHWGVKAGMKVGIVGLGGLGHMAVQIANAMGAEVTVVSTTAEKKEDALRFGGVRFVDSTEKEEMAQASRSLDFILNTIPHSHEIEPYLDLLHRDGAMVLVGVIEPQPGWNPQKLIMQRQTIAGSLIGGIAETKEVLDFCVEHKITPEIQLIQAQDINEAYAKVKSKKARYRFVIDIASLAKEDVASLGEIDPVGHVLIDQKVKMEVPEVHVGNQRMAFEPAWNSPVQ